MEDVARSLPEYDYRFLAAVAVAAFFIVTHLPISPLVVAAPGFVTRGGHVVHRPSDAERATVSKRYRLQGGFD